jgi:serine-type D-Ala-D-Ala carboxypeptidase (penicillin-binding protein 5/6)
MGKHESFRISFLGKILVAVSLSTALSCHGAMAKDKKVVIKGGKAVFQPTTGVNEKGIPTTDTLAKQAILVDYQTGAVLMEKNADQRMPPSSMTKIMTAYMIFEKIKSGSATLDTLVQVSEKAWRMGGSRMFLPLNEQVKVGDLLKGIIIQSGNDACVAAAEGLEGSEEIFATKMTQRAQELGAKNTTFHNTSGWPHPDHLTTARDLALLAWHTIHDHPEHYSLYGEREFEYNNINQPNRNPLLSKNVGCDGIKTGFTDHGGYGIVASVTQGDRRLILVINGLPSANARANEAHRLSLWGLQMFGNYPLYKKGDLVENVPVWMGEDYFVPATVESDCILTLPRAARTGLKADIQYAAPLQAPIKQGDVIGKLIVTAPTLPKPLEVPLVAAVPIEKAGFLKRVRDSLGYIVWGKATA